MAVLTDETSRTQLLNRLKRAEGQLRGVQRMIEEGQPCLQIATQLAAVRKALDSTFVSMAVCFMQQELTPRMESIEVEELLGDMQALLQQVR
ncbi:MAG: metal-sensitive transcriptional regulator [Rubrivivax sp.]|nr:metal-sensitive transcriptional regulator [Rubrivivax sp.]